MTYACHTSFSVCFTDNWLYLNYCISLYIFDVTFLKTLLFAQLIYNHHTLRIRPVYINNRPRHVHIQILNYYCKHVRYSEMLPTLNRYKRLQNSNCALVCYFVTIFFSCFSVGNIFKYVNSTWNIFEFEPHCPVAWKISFRNMDLCQNYFWAMQFVIPLQMRTKLIIYFSQSVRRYIARWLRRKGDRQPE